MTSKAERAKDEAQVEREEAAAEQAHQAKLAKGTKVDAPVSQPFASGVVKGVPVDFAGRPVPEAQVRRPGPSTVDADGYPIASPAAGDFEAVTEAINAVRRVSDVGSLANLLAAVVGHAQAMRVRPDVIKASTKVPA
jgi:hypothetical protein